MLFWNSSFRGSVKRLFMFVTDFHLLLTSGHSSKSYPICSCYVVKILIHKIRSCIWDHVLRCPRGILFLFHILLGNAFWVWFPHPIPPSPAFLSPVPLLPVERGWLAQPALELPLLRDAHKISSAWWATTAQPCQTEFSLTFYLFYIHASWVRSSNLLPATYE